MSTLDPYTVRVNAPMTDLGLLLRICREHGWTLEAPGNHPIHKVAKELAKSTHHRQL